MFDFSFYELVVFGIIALVVLGPEKLPKAVRTAGTYYSKFRRTASTLKAEMEAELDLAETRQQMQKELEKIRQAEAEMQREMAQLRGNMKAFEKQQGTELDDIKSSLLTSNSTNHEDNLQDDRDTSNQLSNSDTKNLSTDKESTEPNIASEQDSSASLFNFEATRPWQNMWFLLGDYDKKRRLPPAPLLPDYKPSALLNVVPSSTATPSHEQPSDASEVSS